MINKWFKRGFTLLLALCLVTTSNAFTSTVAAKNPIITNIYTADPSAHVWADGRIYIYGSHDIEPPRGCDLMDQYHVYSSDDMVNWTDHGEILRASQVPWGRPEGGFMWAPDCVYKNGTYYFYFPHPSDSEWGNSWKIGVATSTKPASDFKVQGYIKGLESMIDPCVFVDDDGQAYLYYGGGGGPGCSGGKLKDNMMEIDGKMKLMEGLVDFHEGTWVFKRNGVYYLTYADNNNDVNGENQMRYATSNNPLGPWVYQGVYLEPTDCPTTHGSAVEYKGKWYQFYHSNALSGNGALRSICVDYLNFNPDGTIQKIIQTNSSVAPAGEVGATFSSADGTQKTLTAGIYYTADLKASGIADNWAESLAVAKGYTVEVYDKNNFKGTKWKFSPDKSDMAGAGACRKMSSVKIIYDDVKLEGPENSYDRTGWAANSWSNPLKVRMALDGKTTTRWDTAAFQSDWMWYSVDMKRKKSFDKIILDATFSKADYPRGYEVYVSDDGENWGKSIAKGKGSPAVTTITFPMQNKRYIKIAQTGSDKGCYWSIHEFYVCNTKGVPEEQDVQIVQDEPDRKPAVLFPEPTPTPTVKPKPTPKAAQKVDLMGKTISLKCASNKLYAGNERGTQSMECDSKSVTNLEKFIIMDAGNGKVAMKGASNKKYVSIGKGTAVMTCSKTTIGSNEKFTLVYNSDGTVSLKGSNGKYVTGASPMKCNAVTIGSAQKFIAKIY